jgi:hypothetical protein
MRIRRMAISVAFAAGLATLPLPAAKAQYYPPYSPPPLPWPICAAGAVAATATTIITAPLRALTGAPPFYYCVTGHRPITDRRPTTRRRITLGHAEPAPSAALALRGSEIGNG